MPRAAAEPAAAAGEPAKEPTMLQTALGSALSSFLSRAPCHPIDTVKSRLQSADGARYRGFVDCFRTTVAEEGLRGLYRGYGAVAVLGTPAAVLYFSSYEALKRLIDAEKSRAELAFLGHLCAGMGAEAAACLIFVPVDVAKERLQVQRPGGGPAAAPPVGGAGASPSSAPPRYAGSLDALRVISRTEGILGIYKGYWATLASFGPFSALYFAFYEEARRLVAAATGAPSKARLSAGGTLAAASLGGAAASVLTSPLDLAKLRLQTQRKLVRGEAPPPGHLHSMLDALRSVHREAGIRGLFRGAGARVLFHTPVTCISFTTFEECRKLLQRVV